ncbi:hypothetical protein K435DRAFT_963563 [Dendrothele bispora CBS 962.96]|uniref:DUF1793-domain-containing protein n=1 Tax=Dendrothele bispora (strain CBS 962.96) TaxID=1314807 RepID=A0A4S8MFD1_DENBC|nr:hypothetical protein K435DRAFT_963563 [Dendrothele bispora CBS 962.96]
MLKARHIISLSVVTALPRKVQSFDFPRNFTPSTYPLAVRSPYLNTWIDATGANDAVLSHDWPKHWDMGQAMGWCGMARIDGTVWQWLGPPTPNSNSSISIPEIRSSTLTPTRTIFELVAGPMLLNISFFNPIETEDLTRQSIPFMYLSLDAQSIPFMYLSLDAQSLDEQEHDVQIYSDISAEWITGDRVNSTVQWSTTLTSSTVFHRGSLQNAQSMVEVNSQAQDATAYYAMELGQGMSWKTGDANITRPLFQEQGNLDNGTDTSFRAVNDQLPVFAFAIDLGSLKSTSSSLTWGLGVVRDPVVRYAASPGGTQDQRPYFYSDPRFSSQRIEDVIDFFMRDYESGLQRAESLDSRILQDALSISGGNEEYFSLVAMGARLVLAGFDITYSIKEGVTDIKAFMKNTGIGSESNNALGLYASLPAFAYLNATWMSYLLDSSMQFQNLLASQDNYAASTNLGNYPNATGGKIQGSAVEDTSSMLIAVAAHARISKDTKIISKYYDLLKTWTEYLLERSWPPINQMTLDRKGTTKDDYTTVALKGIIGISAMAQISAALGFSNDSENYMSNASSLIQDWQTKTVKSNHITMEFKDEDSFALLYDLYADTLLGTNLVNQTVYETHESFCQDSLSSKKYPFGIPVSSYIPETKSMWSMFTAATLKNNQTRDNLIHSMFARATFNQSSGRNFPLIYDSANGLTQPVEGANPQQGGMFALLAFKGASQTVDPSSPETTTPGPNPKSRLGAGKIAGIVVGALVGPLALIIIVTLLLKRRRNIRKYHSTPDSVPSAFLAAPNAGVGLNMERPRLPRSLSSKMANSDIASSASESNSALNESQQSVTWQLRDELVTLRREMEAMRGYNGGEMEPPPGYS